MHAMLRSLSLLLLLAAPLSATNPKPPSGTPFGLDLGDVAVVKLANAGGCTFDYSSSVSIGGVISITNDSGAGKKGASINIEAVGVGSTMLTIMSFNGTCPPATHTFPVTVSADYGALAKDFDKLAKSEFGQLRLDVKTAFKGYSGALNTLAVQYKDESLTDDELQDGFHAAAVTLRTDWFSAGTQAFADVIGGGTQHLADAGAVFGEVPIGFFAGGCGSFDWFQDSVCGLQADFHDGFDKASKKGIKAFDKAGGPILGQWNTLLPLYSGGPLYPAQALAVTPPMALAGPLTFTTRPSTSAKGDGRLLVSGMASTAFSGQFEVSLTRQESGQDPVTQTETPEITADEWIAAFENLSEGSYTLSTGYTGDTGKVQLLVHIPFRF